MHVVWIVVEVRVCVRQVKRPNEFETLSVRFTFLVSPFGAKFCICCSTYVDTNPTSANAKPFDGRYGLGLEHSM